MTRKDYSDRYRVMGFRIAYYRKLAGYTQEEFAGLIGKSWNYVAQIEGSKTAREFSLETLLAICELLNIQPGKLLDEEK